MKMLIINDDVCIISFQRKYILKNLILTIQGCCTVFHQFKYYLISKFKVLKCLYHLCKLSLFLLLYIRQLFSYCGNNIFSLCFVNSQHWSVTFICLTISFILIIFLAKVIFCYSFGCQNVYKSSLFPSNILTFYFFFLYSGNNQNI